jgi:uncharacterized protein (UPF0218 family)
MTIIKARGDEDLLVMPECFYRASMLGTYGNDDPGIPAKYTRV